MRFAGCFSRVLLGVSHKIHLHENSKNHHCNGQSKIFLRLITTFTVLLIGPTLHEILQRGLSKHIQKFYRSIAHSAKKAIRIVDGVSIYCSKSKLTKFEYHPGTVCICGLTAQSSFAAATFAAQNGISSCNFHLRE